MRRRQVLRWIAITVITIVVAAVAQIFGHCTVAWLNGAGYLSPSQAQLLNSTVHYPVYRYTQNGALPGADALNELCLDCFEAGGEYKWSRENGNDEEGKGNED